VVLAVFSLAAVWFDPAGPARFAATTYSLHLGYLAYSLVLGLFTWQRAVGARLAAVTHLGDIAIFSVFQYLTLGPSSPFFVYFIFSLFCGAIRWGWRGTLSTAGAVLVAYLLMSVSMSRTLGPTEFELNRTIIRTIYLLVSTGLLVYLGRHEERLRLEMQRLARWPAAAGADRDAIVGQVLQHAARILGAQRAVAVWEEGEEPTVHVAAWPSSGSVITRHAPADLSPLVVPELDRATFLVTGDVDAEAPLATSDGRGDTSTWSAAALHPWLLRALAGTGLSSAVFRTGRVAGRAFFGGLNAAEPEVVWLTEVVAREIGASLDAMVSTQQLREIAAREERITLARDLHDGVLQALTGVRLEIRATASALGAASAGARDRLFAIERALAMEQRELRLFIGGLQPAPSRVDDEATLAGRLDAMRQRLTLQWKAPVTIRLVPEATHLPPGIEHAVQLMVHEAVVNALKHAQPSRVSVMLESDPREVRIVVNDDGCGFPFRGRYDHDALMTSETSPKSLLDRVAALGGRMSIESTDAGSRVEMRLSL
jgi:signal transduction histidine kinase